MSISYATDYADVNFEDCNLENIDIISFAQSLDTPAFSVKKKKIMLM